MAIIPDEFFKCVLAVGRQPTSEWFATCFLCSKEIDGLRYHFIISNKHVFENESRIFVRLYNENSKNYESISLDLRDLKGMQCYSSHSTADVAVIFINGRILQENGFKWKGFDVDNGMMTSSEYYKLGGSVGCRVFMLGFPMGLVDIEKNDPICRGGYLARKEDQGFLLDIQNFPGNSGSPIVSCPELISVNNTRALRECSLVGIVNSYIPFRSNLIDTQTKQIVEVRNENSGLANAYSVEIIREAIDIELKRISVMNSLGGCNYEKSNV